MEKGQYIKDILILAEGEILSSIFCRAGLKKKFTRDHSPYLEMLLSDNSGTIKAMMWNKDGISIDEYHEMVKGSQYLRVRGRLERFNNNPQIIISDMGPVGIRKYGPLWKELHKTTRYDIEYLWHKVMKYIKEIEDKDLKTLLLLISTDEKIKSDICSMPAATRIHHSFQGGLIEHIYSVITIIILLKKTKLYRNINWDLLISAAFLHDIGKLYELTAIDQSNDFNYSTMGHMFGHIFIGAMLINKYINKIKGFNENLKIQLIHLILSHHGKLEWGSPVEGKTPEAVLLHSIDHMDAQISHCLETMEKAEGSESEITDRNLSALRKQFYMPKI